MQTMCQFISCLTVYLCICMVYCSTPYTSSYINKAVKCVYKARALHMLSCFKYYVVCRSRRGVTIIIFLNCLLINNRGCIMTFDMTANSLFVYATCSGDVVGVIKDKWEFTQCMLHRISILLLQGLSYKFNFGILHYGEKQEAEKQTYTTSYLAIDI
jgi:hypothetical protein